MEHLERNLSGGNLKDLQEFRDRKLGKTTPKILLKDVLSRIENTDASFAVVVYVDENNTVHVEWSNSDFGSRAIGLLEFAKQCILGGMMDC